MTGVDGRRRKCSLSLACILRTDQTIDDPDRLRGLATGGIRIADRETARFLKRRQLEVDRINEIGVTVDVRQGSLELTVVIFVIAARTLYQFFKDYKELKEGLRELVSDSHKLAESVREKLFAEGGASEEGVEKSLITSNDFRTLQRILRKLEAGEISQEDALEQIMAVVGKAGGKPPVKLERLVKAETSAAVTRRRRRTPPRPPVRPPARPSRRPRRRYLQGVHAERRPGSTKTTTRDLS